MTETKQNQPVVEVIGCYGAEEAKSLLFTTVCQLVYGYPGSESEELKNLVGLCHAQYDEILEREDKLSAA